ncbi:MAG: hypothetical protein KZQ75_07810 [Candidatus Thiodiazotropha sp. (ex Myrtea spinifera)]|nr:hypothetical protein [Candidatus Thiodiazotropha sp. (ex Myrtea spinifera)]
MELITSNTFYGLFRHGLQWLANLRRAKQARIEESVQALRQVIIAARETAVYLRQLKETGQQDHTVERHLTVLWTKLGFALQDLGLEKLAKRSQITGAHWADPSRFDEAFLDKADISLERMEQLARQLLSEIEH